MIYAINYSNDKFKAAQKFNSKMAKKFGADVIIEYSDKDLDSSFVKDNIDILSCERGGGYWLWKPYIIDKTLEFINFGDYLIYTDSGSSFVAPIKKLIKAMNREKTDIMCFAIDQIEKKWSKRDALIIMGADEEKYLNSNQICAGYIVIKKTEKTVKLIKEFLYYAEDKRIITDEPNVLGDNYPEFVCNRHDMTVWSLLCKTRGIKPFRDPSEYGLDKSLFTDEINKRSTYPQIIESHRNPNISHWYQLKYKEWYRWVDPNRSPIIIHIKKFRNNMRK